MGTAPVLRRICPEAGSAGGGRDLPEPCRVGWGWIHYAASGGRRRVAGRLRKFKWTNGLSVAEPVDWQGTWCNADCAALLNGDFRRTGHRPHDRPVPLPMAVRIGQSPVWTLALCMGQATTEPHHAKGVTELFALDQQEATLCEIPYRGAQAPPTDPLICHVHESIPVYGTSWKAMIREGFGDGIMSAIGHIMDAGTPARPEGRPEWAPPCPASSCLISGTEASTRPGAAPPPGRGRGARCGASRSATAPRGAARRSGWSHPARGRRRRATR